MIPLFLRFQRSKRSLIESLKLDDKQTAILNEWFKHNCFEIGTTFISTVEAENFYKNSDGYENVIKKRMCNEIADKILKQESLYSEIKNGDQFTGNTIREFSILVFGDPVFIKEGGE